MLHNEQIPTGTLHKTYSTIVTCALPLIAAGLLISDRGRRRFCERLGSWGSPFDVEWWIHGASVGEVQGVLPLIQEVRHQAADDKVLVTSTSPTGLERGEGYARETRLIPIDAPVLVRRAVRTVSCSRFVLSETELWPNLIREVLRTGVPCHIVNGRISDYTFARYTRCRAVFSPLLQRFVSVSVADDEQCERFRSLGVAPERIHVTGHTKYDTTPRYAAAPERQEAREAFFPGVSPDEPIITLGSIREGEEPGWFAALSRAWNQGRRVRVIVAPRHSEKFQFFAEAMSSLPSGVARWSSRQNHGVSDCNAVLLDTMGLLERAYAASDLAFVGATLVDIGGHNPFEPAMYGVPVVVGPYTSVIRDPISQLRDRGALLEVSSEEDIWAVVERLTSRDGTLAEIGRQGQLVWSSHQGAARRVLSVLLQSEARL